MKLVSISELSRLTDKNRETIAKKLAHVPFDSGNDGERPRKDFASNVALEWIYLGRRADGGDDEGSKRLTPQMAAMELNIAKKDKLDLEMEVIRKERIPIEVLNQINEEALLNVSALIKTHQDKVLSAELCNDIFTAIREIGRKVREAAV